MSDNVQSAMLDILKRIQSDVAEMRKRIDSVEYEVKAHRRETRGTLVIMSSVVANSTSGFRISKST